MHDTKLQAIEFASLNQVEKQSLKDQFQNVIVDENSYKIIKGFKGGKLAIANTRQNAKRLLLSIAAGEECVSTDSRSFQQQLPYIKNIRELSWMSHNGYFCSFL